jgi:hypothetical protein
VQQLHVLLSHLRTQHIEGVEKKTAALLNNAAAFPPLTSLPSLEVSPFMLMLLLIESNSTSTRLQHMLRSTPT